MAGMTKSVNTRRGRSLRTSSRPWAGFEAVETTAPELAKASDRSSRLPGLSSITTMETVSAIERWQQNLKVQGANSPIGSYGAEAARPHALSESIGRAAPQ